MCSFSSLAALMASLAIVIANPVDLSIVNHRKQFRIEQAERGKFIKSGPVQMAKTFQKYKVPFPDGLAAAAAATVTGTVSATPEDAYDSLYLSPVNIGGETVMLDFDTGSGDLWVFSDLLPTSQQSGHAVYKTSTGKKLQGYSWDISYGDGSGASGLVYADKVVVGGVTATSQAVEAATSVSAAFRSDVDNDGLLGLSFSSINTVQPVGQKTFFDSVKANLAQSLFTVDLRYHAAGTYDFGFIDNSKYSGSITYVNVNTANGFWEFSSTGYAVGSDSTVAYSFDTIADTGTTLIYVPSSVVSAYYRQVSGAKFDSYQQGYVFPCRTTPPNFSIVIGGVKQTVPGKYINYAPVDGQYCYGGIQSNAGIGFSILGDIFLKSKFVVHKMPSSGTPQIGFAEST